VAAGVVAGAAVAEETADAAGVVPEGAVADSIVVLGGAVVALACPNIFDIKLLNIPISAEVRVGTATWMHPNTRLAKEIPSYWGNAHPNRQSITNQFVIGRRGADGRKGPEI
jgi:hypothetical protein